MCVIYGRPMFSESGEFVCATLGPLDCTMRVRKVSDVVAEMIAASVLDA